MNKKRTAGFTLVELMIVIVIVGILTAVAYPAYTNHVVRGKRTAAASFIMQVANRQEQAMLNSRAYQTTLTALNMSAPKEVSDNYTISVTTSAGPPPAYTVTATPIGSQATKDTKCAVLTYTSTGVKGISGTSTVSDCWK